MVPISNLIQGFVAAPVRCIYFLIYLQFSFLEKWFINTFVRKCTKTSINWIKHRAELGKILIFFCLLSFVLWFHFPCVLKYFYFCIWSLCTFSINIWFIHFSNSITPYDTTTFGQEIIYMLSFTQDISKIWYT